MKKKNKFNTFLALALLLGVTTVGGTALAFDGGDMRLSLDGFSKEQQTAIEKSWEIQKDAHKEAGQILENAGVSMDDIRGARHAQMGGQKVQMDTIFATGDYDAFLEMSSDRPNMEKITEAEFKVLVEAHELMESGDREGAHELLEDAGIEKNGGQRMKGQRGDRQ